ncbi:Clp protease N-terminal domain-containing protein [Streptomonospora arabica]|uniref:Clp protease N-terminal domain-containing protein n=1 Tax=Streptomonospora arabica TaxID=412417 RepID=A0ABV9STB4_9ACTN
MFDQFTSSPFVVVVTAAREEARQRGAKRMGTEHLLLGLLHETGSASVRALGVDLEAAYAALEELDREALHAIGVDVGDLAPALSAPARTAPPLTSTAQAVLSQAVKNAKARTRDIDTVHLLHVLLDRKRPDPAAELLARLGVDRGVVRGRLQESGS